MATKILQTHDLPASGPIAVKKLTVVTTSDFDIKGKLKDTARKRIEGTDQGAAIITTGDLGKKTEK